MSAILWRAVAVRIADVDEVLWQPVVVQPEQMPTAGSLDHSSEVAENTEKCQVAEVRSTEDSQMGESFATESLCATLGTDHPDEQLEAPSPIAGVHEDEEKQEMGQEAGGTAGQSSDEPFDQESARQGDPPGFSRMVLQEFGIASWRAEIAEMKQPPALADRAEEEGNDKWTAVGPAGGTEMVHSVCGDASAELLQAPEQQGTNSQWHRGWSNDRWTWYDDGHPRSGGRDENEAWHDRHGWHWWHEQTADDDGRWREREQHWRSWHDHDASEVQADSFNQVLQAAMVEVADFGDVQRRAPLPLELQKQWGAAIDAKNPVALKELVAATKVALLEATTMMASRKR